MSTFNEQLDKFAAEISSTANAAPRALYKRVLDHLKNKLTNRMTDAANRCQTALEKMKMINDHARTQRDQNLREYREAKAARIAYLDALEMLSDVPVDVPPPRGGVDGTIAAQLRDFASVIKAGEAKKSKTKKQAAPQLRIRAAAKKSTRNK